MVSIHPGTRGTFLLRRDYLRSTCQGVPWSPPTDLVLHSKREACEDPIGYSAETDSTYPCANDDDISEGMPSFATDAS